MIEQYEDKEALDAHMQADHFKAFCGAAADILAEEMGVDIYSADRVSAENV